MMWIQRSVTDKPEAFTFTPLEFVWFIILFDLLFIIIIMLKCFVNLSMNMQKWWWGGSYRDNTSTQLMESSVTVSSQGRDTPSPLPWRRWGGSGRRPTRRTLTPRRGTAPCTVSAPSCRVSVHACLSAATRNEVGGQELKVKGHRSIWARSYESHRLGAEIQRELLAAAISPPSSPVGLQGIVITLFLLFCNNTHSLKKQL